MDRDALRKQLEKQKARRQGGGVNYLKKGTKTLRIVTFADDDDKEQFARAVHEYRTSGGDFLLDRTNTLGLPCACTRLAELAQAQGRDSPFSRRRTSWYVNAIDLDESPDKVTIWQIPTTVWESIAELVVQDEWADVLDHKTGHAFTITKSGEGLGTEYSAIPTRAKHAVKAALLKQVVDPLMAVRDPGVEGQCEKLMIKPEDVFEDIDSMEGVEPVARDNRPAAASAEEPTPAASKKKTSKKKQSKKPKDTHGGIKQGDEVTALYEDDGNWYAGAVVGLEGDGIVHVRFEDGDETRVHFDNVKVTAAADDDLPFVGGNDKPKKGDDDEGATNSSIASLLGRK